MRYEVKDNEVTIFLPIRIDSKNYEDIKKEIEDAISESGCTNICFDSTDTVFVSSAGLRVFMIMYKKYKIRFTNVSDNVREIFDIAGFINIFL